MPFDTIRQTIDKGDRIAAYCTIDCGFSQDLDLQALGERMGFDFEVSAYSLNHRLRCKRCGQFTMSIRLHVNVKPIPVMDTHGRIGREAFRETKKAPPPSEESSGA